MKFKVLNLSAALVAALSFGSFAFAQENSAAQNAPRETRDFRRHRSGALRGLEGLNLTDAQKQQIQSIRENAKNNFAERDELKQLKSQQRSGAQLTAEQTARVNQLREQRRAAKEQMRQQIATILTVEQRAQLETLKAERKENKREFGFGGQRGNKSFGRGEFGGLRGLNLTEAQREQLRALNQTVFDSAKAQREELRSLYRQRQSNAQLTAEQQSRLEDLRRQLHQAREQMRQNLQTVLTPEQRQQLETQRQQLRQRFELRRQMRRSDSETPQQ